MPKRLSQIFRLLAFSQWEKDEGLRRSARKGDLTNLSSWIDAGAGDLDDALCAAARCGQLDALRLLIDAGADPVAMRGAPLLLAAGAGHTDIVLELGRLNEVAQRSGGAALVSAAAAGHTSTVAALLSIGVEPTDDALELARHRGHSAVVSEMCRSHRGTPRPHPR